MGGREGEGKGWSGRKLCLGVSERAVSENEGIC